MYNKTFYEAPIPVYSFSSKYYMSEKVGILLEMIAQHITSISNIQAKSVEN